MNEPYEMTAAQTEKFRRVQAKHVAAAPCHACRTPTHNVDSKSRPFCVPCKVTATPKDPQFANWKNGPALKEDV